MTDQFPLKERKSTTNLKNSENKGECARSRKFSNKKNHSIFSINSRKTCVLLFVLSTFSYLGIAFITSSLSVFDHTAGLYLSQHDSQIRNSLLIGFFKAWIRWDAIYFVDMSLQNRLFEQEWAFSDVWGALIRFICFESKDVVVLGLGACCLAIVLHAIAAVAFYCTTNVVFFDKRISVLSVIFYLFSPAGIFMSVGYTESAFSACSFLGLLCYVQKRQTLAMMFWSISTLFRSNGLFWSLLFVIPTTDTFFSFVRQKVGVSKFLRTAFLNGCRCIGIAVPFLYGQFQAYKVFCPRASWCLSYLPFIYPAVQKKYWNIGFLNYWTSNNIPNFFLACITFIPLVFSLWYSITSIRKDVTIRYLFMLSLFYLYLGIFQMHTQVLNRLSSSFPLLYWSLAHAWSQSSSLHVRKFTEIILFSWVLYTLIQAGLYGSFLPPA
ncbi:pig-V, dolichyl-phosphate-mannose-glycolipid alpha-mannosyltransferase [Schizosaccharomyces osmophilus]|uniref:GPI mannosyltransferase 2 n=1 Tax=Schizosaccharomyces osmophilus TaxID=2545709 RepID=A0AAE9WDN3_9SCHI|nr:pig-V, dolichyl-phosphate-mannose-glycolipid alpha-mannosyltransferase [Schizosaccharomyces osmophilus]WBW73287.1 pig-V, dolichyl-phosphate-mannose-glycolipid alpha-mannosyltransferase [Schizosaccharomyces osmophilus]